MMQNKEKLVIEAEISELQQLLLDDPSNTQALITLSFRYIKKELMSESLYTLKKVLKEGNKTDKQVAKILISIINDNNTDIIKNNEHLRFLTYIQFNAYVDKENVKVKIDGNTIKQHMNKEGILVINTSKQQEVLVSINSELETSYDFMFGLVDRGEIARNYSIVSQS